MARVKIDLKEITKLLKDAPREAALKSNRKIAETVRQKILSLVSKGISPIEGNGRFDAYKKSTKKKKKYPDTVRDSFPGKRRRPVNLYLSGDFLRELESKPTSATVIEVGFADGSYGEKLEQGHREGVNGQAKRPIIPILEKGEAFTKTIQSAMLKLYRDEILKYLKR